VLSPRLKSFLDQGLHQQPLWDIGCDHAQLAETAFFSGNFTEVHFVDPVALQIQKSQRRLMPHLAKQGSSRAYFHPVKAEALNQPIAGTVVCAGMGARKMQDILAAWRDKGILQAKRLVLSPHRDLENLLSRAGEWTDYTLIQQEQLTERGRLRPLLVFEQKK